MTKTAVIYFSWSETTKKIAESIADEIGADLYRIETKRTYSKNYPMTATIALLQHLMRRNLSLATKIPNWDDYNRVIIGTPIWWYALPQAVISFIQQYDFSGKDVYVFCTHLGSGASQISPSLKRILKNSNYKGVIDAVRFTKSDIIAWLNQ